MKIKLSIPFLMLLLMFSCAKENQDFAPENTTNLTQLETPVVDAQTLQVMQEIEAELMQTDTVVKKKCACKPVTYVSVFNITPTSVTVSWSAPTFCGSYFIMVRNLSTGTYTYYQYIPGFSYTINGLDPCTEYEVGIGHIGSYCVSIPYKVTFETECCEPGSNNPGELYIQYITLTIDQHPGISSGVPSPGYIDKTNEELTVPSNTVFPYSAAGMCYDGNWSSIIYAKLWIDYNGNGIYESSELAYSYVSSVPLGSSGSLNCLDMSMPGFTTPNLTACNVTARFIISSNPISGPCEVVNRGQVMDFSVDVGTCSDL